MYRTSVSLREELNIERFTYADQEIQKFITNSTTGTNGDPVSVFYTPKVTQLVLNALNHTTPDIKQLKQATKMGIPLLCLLVAINPKISSFFFKTLIKDEAILSFVVTYSGTPVSVLEKVMKIAPKQTVETVAARPGISTEIISSLLNLGDFNGIEALAQNRQLTTEQIELTYEHIPVTIKQEALTSQISHISKHLLIVSILAHPNVPVWILEKFSTSENYTIIEAIIRSKRVTDEIINHILFPGGLLRLLPEEIVNLLVEVIKNPKTSTITLMKIVAVLNNIPPKYKYRSHYNVDEAFKAVEKVFSKRSPRRMRKELSRFLSTIPGYDETDYTAIPYEWIKALTGTTLDEQYKRDMLMLLNVH